MNFLLYSERLDYILKLVLKFIINFTILLCTYSAGAQTANDYIEVYNDHIDPMHALDSLRVFYVTKEINANGVLNAIPMSVITVNECQYFADGSSQFIDSKTGNSIDMNFFPVAKNGFNNALKTELNFISTNGDSTLFQFKMMNDSITVIEKTLNVRQKFVYTFESKTKNLLQIENNAEKSEKPYSSRTRFLSYFRVNGILVPGKITVVNNFCVGTLEYSNCSFK